MSGNGVKLSCKDQAHSTSVDVKDFVTGRSSLELLELLKLSSIWKVNLISGDSNDNTTRNGTVFSCVAQVITTLVGSGVLSLPWAIAQMGWSMGPLVLLLFGSISFYTSMLLAENYRTPDPETGNRNPTYVDSVYTILGRRHRQACSILQFVSLFGTCVCHILTASSSLQEIHRQLRDIGQPQVYSGESLLYYILGFAAVQMILCQIIPDFSKLTWPSVVTAVLSVAYTAIGFGLSIAKIYENGPSGTLIGTSVGTGQEEISLNSKLVSVATAFGYVAFAYSSSTVLRTIQDTLKSPPSEIKQMKKASSIGISTTTLVYVLFGCGGYAAFGNNTPENLLATAGGGFYDGLHLMEVANICFVIHVVGAYQIYAQPFFAFVEKFVSEDCPESLTLINKNFEFTFFCGTTFQWNLYRLTWRPFYVILTTLVAILIPNCTATTGLLGAMGFWPLTIYFPVEMYKKQAEIKSGSTKWFMLNALSCVFLLVSVAATVSFIYSIIYDSSDDFHPFWSL